MKKSTEELLALLRQAEDLDAYFDAADEDLVTTSLPVELHRLIAARGEKPAEVLRRAGIEKSYGYDILSGKREPARDKVLALLFGLAASAAEAQALLKSCGYPPLYPRDTRDAVILFCLDRGIELPDCNETLYDMGLALIG